MRSKHPRADHPEPTEPSEHTAGDLYPTPTRRDLLDAIAGQHVLVAADGRITLTDTGRRVTAAVDEMVQAGWATKPAGGGTVQLTATGRAVRAVRILNYGDHVVAETGPHDAATCLGTAYQGVDGWTVTVGPISLTCGSPTAAANELRRRAVGVLAAQDPDR
ncbi:hypothetical protein WEI85_00700 [Actinomycetes bacterium KLBMP 9797]